MCPIPQSCAVETKIVKEKKRKKNKRAPVKCDEAAARLVGIMQWWKAQGAGNFTSFKV